jgi:hypothetical protein
VAVDLAYELVEIPAPEGKNVCGRGQREQFVAGAAEFVGLVE